MQSGRSSNVASCAPAVGSADANSPPDCSSIARAHVQVLDAEIAGDVPLSVEILEAVVAH